MLLSYDNEIYATHVIYLLVVLIFLSFYQFANKQEMKFPKWGTHEYYV